ncbi:MAG: TolC family protein [Gammaproteobacteria bacterium]
MVLICGALYTWPAAAGPLTLGEAFQRAERANPTLRQARAELQAAHGALKDTQGWFWNNPEIFTDVRNRDVTEADQSDNNFEETIGLSQTFELAGQQGARRDTAQAGVAATRQEILEIRRQIRTEVEGAFVQVLSLQQRIRAELETLRLIEEAARAVSMRVEAGKDSPLQANLAEVEAERARNQVALLREELTEARATLAALLQLAANRLPRVTGSLEPAPASYSLEALLESAANRPGLRALQHRVEAATSQLELQRKQVYPDLTVGLSRGREVSIAGDDEIIGLNFSVPIPLFRRNATGIAQAATELTQTSIERQAVYRNVRAQVIALWRQLESLGARVTRLRQSIGPRLEENLRLSTASYQAGEIGITELLLVNRQTLDGRRDLLDAATGLRLTKSRLEAAAGWPIDGGAR